MLCVMTLVYNYTGYSKLDLWWEISCKTYYISLYESMQIQNKKQNIYFLKQNHVLIFQADSYYYQQYLMFHISYTLCFLVRNIQVTIISIINHRDVDIKHLFHQQITCKTCKSRKIIHPFLASRNFYFSLFKITRTSC